MIPISTPDQVLAVAGGFGITLSREEADVYCATLNARLREFENLVQARPSTLHELRYPGPRDLGHKPTQDEDQFNAWLWKCEISGGDKGLLVGKTISFKDHISVAGLPMTFGSFVLDGYIPDFDATIVTRALAAGCTVVGKNSMTGFSGGFGNGGAIGDYGRPLNPRNIDHLPGGSSSGSAIAVVAGEVDVSIGGDQGGSIRIPSAWCGAVGLKPTFGLISHFGAGFGWDHTLDHVGPIGRNAEDVARVLDAVAGADALDPRQGRDVPLQVDSMRTLHDGVAGVRIGVLREAFDDVDDDVRSGVLKAIDALAGCGAQVEEVSVPVHGSAPAAARALVPEGARAVYETGIFGALAKTYHPPGLISAVTKAFYEEIDHFSPRTKFTLILGEFVRQRFHGRVYAAGQNLRPDYTAAYDSALSEVDVLAMPTCKTKSPKCETPKDYLEEVRDNIEHIAGGDIARNTMPFDYTGHPALAMPCGSSEGLPLSVQFVGRHHEDGLLLRVAQAYEASVDWMSVSV